MARGLEKILEKIGENPRQTLIGRYLSLIADISDEDERASYALSLAERLVGAKTNDALRIAYMVYDSGRHLARALRVVIACFEDKGRAGKVAVLKLELAKLEKDLREESPEESRRRQKPLPDFSLPGGEEKSHFAMRDSSMRPPMGAPGLPREDTRMAELDLGDLAQDDSSAEDAVDLLFPDRKEESFVEEESRFVPELDLAEGFLANFSGRPGDTVLPGLLHRFSENKDDDSDGSGTMVSQVVPREQVRSQLREQIRDRVKAPPPPPARTVKLDEMPRISLDQPSRVSEFVPPPEPRQTRGAAPSEIFDRFFDAGKYPEAEVVLESSRSDSSFEWWKSRRERLDQKLRAKEAAALNAPAPEMSRPVFAGQAPVTSTFVAQPVMSLELTVEKTKPRREEPGKPFSGDFRKGVTTEMLRISDRMALFETKDRKKLIPLTEAGGDEESQKIPAALLKALSARPLTSDADYQSFFDLLQGLFAGRGSEDLLHLIEKRGLCRRSPAWFGFYLDTLLSCGFARKALAESVLASAGQSSLAWIRVIWQRLPQVWDQLGAEGFTWNEEDGTKEFIARINKRPKPQLSHFL